MGERRVQFEVQELFRGQRTRSLTVLAGYCGCTFDFSPGQVYLVYASRNEDGKLYTSTCQRTVPLAVAAADLNIVRNLARK